MWMMTLKHRSAKANDLSDVCNIGLQVSLVYLIPPQDLVKLKIWQCFFDLIVAVFFEFVGHCLLHFTVTLVPLSFSSIQIQVPWCVIAWWAPRAQVHFGECYHLNLTDPPANQQLSGELLKGPGNGKQFDNYFVLMCLESSTWAQVFLNRWKLLQPVQTNSLIRLNRYGLANPPPYHVWYMR